MEIFSSYQQYYLIAAGFCVCTLCWSFSISFVFLIAICTTFLLGFALCHFLLQNPDFCWWLQLVYLNFTNPDKKEIEKDVSHQKRKNSKENFFCNASSIYPWDNLKFDSSLNQEMEDFFETLLENYVNYWYTEQISDDASFLLEIRQLIRYSSAKIIKALIQTDLQAIFNDDIVPILFAHIERICRYSKEVSSDFAFAQPDSLFEMKILERYEGLHWALQSPENQANYLRAIADSLLCKFVDGIRIGGCFVDEEQRMLTRQLAISSSTKWSCHSSRHFLREILYSTILVPTIDLIVDPDSLNRLALSIFNKTGGSSLNTVYSSNYTEKLPRNIDGPSKYKFLARFTEQIYNQTPDSLLAVKLLDLVRDAYLLKLFEIYIRDLNGSVNYLNCFLQAREIHIKIQKIYNNCYEQDKKEQYINEIYLDSWQLFSEYIHYNAHNQIQFDEELITQFSKIMESNRNFDTIKELEHIIENIYQEVYQHLQYNYVIPFCQSENYLGFLCGAPPDVNELICGPDESSMRKHRKLPDGSFSLSQFRKKLFNFINPSKDISANSIFYPSASVSDLDAAREADEISELDSENGSIALCDLGRDIGKWTVSIEGVEQRKESVSGAYFVFLLNIERNDFSEEYFANQSDEFTDEDKYGEYNEKLPKLWSIGHRYEEFYALEDKLREYYGTNIRFSALPDRKTTLQLLRIGRNSRTLMESHRAYFERFLQQLIQQPALKHSELLYVFFTCDEDSSGIFELPEEIAEGSTFLPDLNPIRAMRRVAKERGQNLKPFILNLLANVLAPPARSISQRQQFTQSSLGELRRSPQLPTKNTIVDGISHEHQRSMSISSSLCNESYKEAVIRKSPKSYSDHSNVPRENQSRVNSNIDYDKPYWNRNLCNVIYFFLTNIGFFKIPIWIDALFCSLNSFIGYISSYIIHKKVKEITEQNLFTIEMAIYFVRSLHELILFSNGRIPSLSATPSQISLASSAFSPSNNQESKFKKHEKVAHQQASTVLISDQERILRAELLLHCLKESAEENFPCSYMFSWIACKIGIDEGLTTHSMETAIHQLFNCFQMPKLNKQLAFVLLDIIVQKILINPQKINR